MQERRVKGRELWTDTLYMSDASLLLIPMCDTNNCLSCRNFLLIVQSTPIKLSSPSPLIAAQVIKTDDIISHWALRETAIPTHHRRSRTVTALTRIGSACLQARYPDEKFLSPKNSQRCRPLS